MLVNYYRRSLSMMTDCLRPKLIARFVQLRYSKKHECHFVTFRVRIDSSAWTVNPPTSPRKVWHASGKQRNNLYSQKIPQLSSTATLKLPYTEMNETIFLISGLMTFSLLFCHSLPFLEASSQCHLFVRPADFRMCEECLVYVGVTQNKTVA